MKNRALVLTVCSVLLCVIVIVFIVAQRTIQTSREAQNAFAQEAVSLLLDSMKEKDYDTFTAQGTDAFKESITTEMFDAITDSLSILLHSGHALEYLGELSEVDQTLYLWKLSFEKLDRDVLVKLYAKDKKINGFLIS